MVRRLIDRLVYRMVFRREYDRQLKLVNAILADDELRPQFIDRFEQAARNHQAAGGR